MAQDRDDQASTQPKKKVTLSFLAQQYGLTAEDLARRSGCSVDEVEVEKSPGAAK